MLRWDLIFKCLSSITICSKFPVQWQVSQKTAIPGFPRCVFQGYLTLANTVRAVRKFPGPWVLSSFWYWNDTVTRKHLLVLLSPWWFFFCLVPKVLNLILPSRLGRRGASESAPQTPHVTDRAWKITFCLLCQNPKQLISWSLVCNSLSSYISVWSDTDTSVIFSFSVPLLLHRPDTSLRAQFKFTDEILKTKSRWRDSWLQISSMDYLNGALFA